MSTIVRQPVAGLSTLVRSCDEAAADTAIVLLHGWGADGADLMDLSPQLAVHFPKAVIVAPDGPQPCSANPMGRQWFDLGGDATKLDEGPALAFPVLSQFLVAISDTHDIKPEKLVLLGFSQGGMMAMHVGLRLAHAPAAVVSIAGALLAPGQLAQSITSKPPVMLIHGEDDQVVPHQAMGLAKTVLEQNSVHVETMSCPDVGHGITAEGFAAAMGFIAKHLEA